MLGIALTHLFFAEYLPSILHQLFVHIHRVTSWGDRYFTVFIFRWRCRFIDITIIY